MIAATRAVSQRIFVSALLATKEQRLRRRQPVSSTVLNRHHPTRVHAPSAQLDRVRSVEAEQESLHLRLRQRTLLVLLTPPVPGHAPRLVYRQRRRREQHQQAAG